MIASEHPWHLQVGDPSIMGWSITFAYLVTTAICFWRAKRSTEQHKFFWFLIGLFLILMGINKQLDLQTLFIQTAKHLSIEYGWYEHRHKVVLGFIAALLLWGAASQAWLYSVMEKLDRYEKLALFGLGILFVFIAARAAAFQHMDIFANSKMLAQRMYWAMEMSGIVCIAAAASFQEFARNMPQR